MKIILMVLSLFVFLQGAAFDNSNTNYLYTPKGKKIEILLHKQIRDTLFIIGSKGEFIALDPATGQRAFFAWYTKMLDPELINDFEVLPGLKVYLATEDGLYAYLPKFSGQPAKVRFRLPPGNILQVRSVNDNLVLLYEGQIILTDTKIWKDLGVNLRNTIGDYQKLYFGPGGKIWISAEKALVCVDGTTNQIYSRGRAFNATPEAVYCTTTGQMFARSSRELVMYSPSVKKWKRLATSGIPDGQVYVSPAGHIYIYKSYQLNSYQKGHFIKIELPEFIADEDLIGIYDNGFDEMYFITRNSVTTRFLNNESALLVQTATAQLPNFLAASSITSGQKFNALEKEWLSRLPFFDSNQQNNLLNSFIIKGSINRSMTDLYFNLYPLSPIKNIPRIQQRFIRAQFQTEPRLAERIQEDRIRLATDPSLLIGEYRELAALYRAAGQVALEAALYNEVLQKYKVQNQNYFWLQFRAAQIQGESSPQWQGLSQGVNDPVLKTLIRQHNYMGYTQNFYNAVPGSGVQYQKAQTGNGVRQLLATNEGVWILNTNQRVEFWDGTEQSQMQRPSNSRIKALAGSPFGTAALLTNGSLRLLDQEGIKSLPVAPPNNSSIDALWFSGNTLICKRNKSIYYTSGDGWQQFRLPASVSGFHFIKIIPLRDDKWLLVHSNKIYMFDRSSGNVQGLQAPGQVLRIFDVVGNVEGGFYAATNAGLFSVYDQDWKMVDKNKGYWGRQTLALAFTNSSNTLLALTDSTAFLRLNQLWLPFQEAKTLFSPVVESISLAEDGTVYCGSGSTVYSWQRSNGDERLIGINAARTAGYLENANNLQLLKSYLKKFTGSTFSGWAYEYLSRVELKSGMPQQAWEMLRIGAKTNAGSIWLSDTTVYAFCWRLLEANAWNQALQSAQFFNTNFKESPFNSNLKTMLFKYVLLGDYVKDLEKRLAILDWLANENYIPDSGALIDTEYHIFASLVYRESNNRDIKPIVEAVKKFPASRFVPFWRYQILLHVAGNDRDAALKGCDAFIETLPDNSPFLNYLGVLRLDTYLKKILNK